MEGRREGKQARECAEGEAGRRLADGAGVRVVQEVVKACTGHSMPLQQFLFFDAFEALPDDDQQLPTEEDCK